MEVWIPASGNTVAEKPGFVNVETIQVYTADNWSEVQNVEGPKPILIGNTTNYVIAYNKRLDCPTVNNQEISNCTTLAMSWESTVVKSFAKL